MARTGEDGPRQSTPAPDDGLPIRRIIRQPEVMKLTGIGNRQTLLDMENRGDFPKRFTINPAASYRFSQKGWYLDEVMEFVEQRGASRDRA